MKKSIVLTGVLSTVLVLLSAGTAAAGQACQNVNAHLSGFAQYAGEEACGVGYAWCSAVRVYGTLNGEWVTRWKAEGDDGAIEYPAFGEVQIVKKASGFQTNRGEISTLGVSFSFWRTVEAIGDYAMAETHVITGGTEKYEGATGVISIHYLWFEGEGDLSGQICWPEE